MSDRAVLYARVSTRDTDSEASKLNAQIELCRKVADRESYTVVAEHQEPEHTSGASQHPPELTKIIELAQNGEFEVLICRSLTRLARDIHKQFRVENTLKKLGVRIEYYKYKFPDTAEGKFQKNIFAVLAEYERENIAFRTHYGKRKKVEAGKVYVNGIAPYGYKEHNVEVGGEIVERTLKVIPEEAEIIREIFDMYTANLDETKASIARHLTAKGIAPPGHKRYLGEVHHVAADAAWRGSSITKLLKRKTYIGTWEYGKKGNDIIPVQVDPIVDEQIWHKAQDKLALNLKHRSYTPSYQYLLRDIAICGVCGSPVAFRTDKKASGVRYYSYWCSKAHHTSKARCEHRATYRADIIDKKIWSDMQKILSDPTGLKDAHSMYMQSATARTNPFEKQLDTKQKLVRKNKRKLKKLLDIYLDGDISKTQYQNRKTKLEDEMNRYQSEVDTIKQGIQHQQADLAKQHTLSKYTSQLENKVASIADNSEAKIEIMKKLGVAVILYPEGETKQIAWGLLGENNRVNQPPRLATSSFHPPPPSLLKSYVYTCEWLFVRTLTFKNVYRKNSNVGRRLELVGVA